MADVCEIKVGFKDATLATRMIKGVWTTSTSILFNQERIMATIASFGGEIEQFGMDVDKLSLAARWLEWKSSAGRKLKKVYETLPEPTGLAEDADVYAGNINQPFE